jgi:flagellar hook assembly protein FlgD
VGRRIMKKTLLTFGAVLCASLLYGEKGPVYISPNNDGVQDILEVPLQIKEKRYVSEWSFIIRNEKGEVIRTIGNKEKRPERLGLKNFFKQMVTPKTGVTIPASVTWNGIMDNGETAPDGTYYYSFSASDDNGNSATTSQLVVIVDNTAPEIELTQPSQDAKIFGEGAKASLSIKQDGSKEDLWTGTFSDAAGTPVRVFKWTESEPLKFDWSGTDDNGVFVKDGVYSYKITATDRAGNVSAPAVISNIIYSAEKPATNITLTGGRYFSPNGDGVNDTVSFEVKIPAPDQSKTGNKLVEWAVSVEDKDGKAVKTFSGTDNPPSSVVFDGKTDNGSAAPEGIYYAKVTAKYLNGFETVPLKSPEFMLDNTAPNVKVSLSNSTFSPDGDGNLDVLEISQVTAANGGSPVSNWTGLVTHAAGTIVKTFDFGSFLPEKLVWNGLDKSNVLSKDGSYRYTLSAGDAAGNSVKIDSPLFSLDTSKTELILTASPAAFNPSSGSVKFTPVVKSGSSVKDWKIEVKDTKGTVVWSQSAQRALPAVIEWNGLASDGSRTADGLYTAKLSTESANGAKAVTVSQPFTVDTVSPSIELSVPYTVFSPDGDGNRDNVPVTVKSSKEEKWTAAVLNSKNQTVKSYSWTGTVPAFAWDGTDDSGNKVADGTYKMVFASTDAAGNKASAEIAGLTVDKRETKAYVTADSEYFSPNGDGIADVQKFTVRTSLAEGISNWSFSITSAEGKVVRKWTSADSKNLPAVINWDGNGTDGKVCEGAFTGNLALSYEKGNTVTAVSSAFICTVTPPQLTVKTAPRYFSPDNDGEDDDLYIQLKGKSAVPLKNWSFQINDPENGKKFWSVNGKQTITERLVWDGRGNNGELVQSAMDYPYVFTATDSLGMTSTVEGKISVDVLVIRVGDVLKMAVPSIIFRSDAADFKTEDEIKGGIKASQKANNERVLKRIAQILNKFKNYTVTIEGHANNVSGTEAEENQDTVQYGKALKPLSQERAEFVKSELKKNGVDGSRLTAVGRGGSQPVVARSDKDNWWKNRRVEFILNK